MTSKDGHSSPDDPGGPDAQGAERTSPHPEPEDPPETVLINRQRMIRRDWRPVRQFLDRLATGMGKGSFAVMLVSNRTMRRYNRQFRSRNEATDVLSFPSQEAGAGRTECLGDILLSVEMAEENARRYRVAPEDEVRALILHGLLHLLGYDHETDRGQMARMEQRWGRKLGLPRTLLHRNYAGRKRSGDGRAT